MSGFAVLILLLFVSSVPAIAVFVWFRLARYPFSPLRFSVSLLAGAASFFPALFLQNLFPAEAALFRFAGRWEGIAEIFIRIALSEEVSRLIILALLFAAFARSGGRKRGGGQAAVPAGTFLRSDACAAGLAAGLGFAILESAVYGASDPANALLRIFTAAPLHGTCGARVGDSVLVFLSSPARAVFRFLSAVIVHGVYNLMLAMPGALPKAAAVLIALTSFAVSVVAVRAGMKEKISAGSVGSAENK